MIGTSATRLAMLIRAIGRLDAPAVNRLVAGSNPARGATANQILSTIRILQFHPAWHAIGTQVERGPPHLYEHSRRIESDFRIIPSLI